MKKITDLKINGDNRNLSIDRVGVTSVLLPLKVPDRARRFQVITATVNAYIGLPHYERGAHMSRFIEVLNDYTNKILTLRGINSLLMTMQKKLHAEDIYFDMTFIFFKEKTAPITKYQSLLDYQCKIEGQRNKKLSRVFLTTNIPVLNLCPASKWISKESSHSQRAIIAITVEPKITIFFEELIDLAEKEASVELFNLLKLKDEKYITEMSYENPKFVEDTVRDIALKLTRDDCFKSWSVSCENQESIHTHNVYAKIERKSL